MNRLGIRLTVGNHMNSGATVRYSNFRKDESSVDCLFLWAKEMITQTVDGKSVYLGTYDTPELAHDAYVAAKRQMHIGGTL